MKKYLVVILLIFIANFLSKAQMHLSPTKYDYSTKSAEITRGCTTKMQQAEAIYKWLCQNIAYDTSKTIRDADTCYELKKGVCQAYSELFYRLAEPLNLSTIIVNGTTKEDDGTIPEIGHSWVIVDVGEYHILIDPTWGAGWVDDDNVFHFNENDMSWFNVNPYWMIFTHFPNDAEYQMLETPIDLETFKRLPNSIKPGYGAYGLNAKATFQATLNGTLSLPELSLSHKGLSAFNIPLDRELRVGQKYNFTVRKSFPVKVALVNGDRFVKEDQWVHQDDLCGIQFMPTREADVILAIEADNAFYHVVTYKVCPATAQDWANVEPYYPLEMPELKKLENYNADLIEKLGINGVTLLQRYRAGEIGEGLPQLYSHQDNIQLANIPLSGKLTIGKFYDFVVKKTGTLNVMLYSDGEAVKEAQWQNLGEYIGIKYMPKSQKNLVLALELPGGSQYSTVAEYQIAQPSQADWENLSHYYPYSMPELKNISGFDPDMLEQIGINGHRFLQLYRSGAIGSALPIIYTHAKQLQVVDIPLSKRLRVGQSYRFSFRPISGSDWYISNGNEITRDDFRGWTIDRSTGTISMTVTPRQRGELKLVVGNGQGSQYFVALGYIVE